MVLRMACSASAVYPFEEILRAECVEAALHHGHGHSRVAYAIRIPVERDLPISTMVVGQC